MIPRHLQSKLLESAGQYPVVTVTGPRQSGKTTLCNAVFRDHAYASLETPDTRSFALEDPRSFLNQFSGGVVLDEIQRAPELFSYLQQRADASDQAGRFVLTGSQNFLLMEKISQSLAGRCAVLHLLPFSRTELLRQPSPDPAAVDRPSGHAAASSAELFDMLWRGFYPRIHDRGLDPQDWLANYYRTYLERDVRQLANIGDMETFGRFVRLCAGRNGQLLNLSSLATDAGVSVPTAKRWLSILQTGFIVHLLRPHYRNFSKRLIKSPKLYFLDTGLLCYLLRIRTPEDLRIHPLRGGIFESWVLSEIIKMDYNRGQELDVYFWRDSTGNEIDLLLDRGETLIPIEIKSGETFASDFLDGLRTWRDLAGTDRSGALVYGGEGSFMREGVQVIGWNDWLRPGT